MGANSVFKWLPVVFGTAAFRLRQSGRICIIVYFALNMALGSLGLLTCGLAASPVFRACFWGVRARTPSSGVGGLLSVLVKSYLIS